MLIQRTQPDGTTKWGRLNYYEGFFEAWDQEWDDDKNASYIVMDDDEYQEHKSELAKIEELETKIEKINGEDQVDIMKDYRCEGGADDRNIDYESTVMQNSIDNYYNTEYNGEGNKISHLDYDETVEWIKNGCGDREHMTLEELEALDIDEIIDDEIQGNAVDMDRDCVADQIEKLIAYKIRQNKTLFTAEYDGEDYHVYTEWEYFEKPDCLMCNATDGDGKTYDLTANRLKGTKEDDFDIACFDTDNLKIELMEDANEWWD